MQRTQRTINEALQVAAHQVETGGRVAVQTEANWIRAAIRQTEITEVDGHLHVPVVFATETPVRRYNYRYNDYEGEYYDEVLSMDAAHCDLSRINANGPVLDSHDRYGAVGTVTLGVVVPGSATVSGTEARATLRMSNRDELKGLREDIRAGIVANISVGYDVSEFTREESVNTNAVPIYRATKWTPTEISFVPVPADYNSGVRAADSSPPTNLITIPMKYGVRAQRNAAAGASDNGGAAAPTTAPAAQPAAPAPAPAAPAAPAEPAPAPAAPANAAAAERSRVLGIQDAVRAFNMPDTFARTYIENGASLDTVRAAIQTAFVEGDTTRGIGGPNSNAQVNGRAEAERLESFGRAVEASLLLRATPGATPARLGLTDAQVSEGRQLTGMSLIRLAEEYLVVRGVNTRGLSSRRIYNQAMGLERSSGEMTTSDFPLLLASTISRTLQREYAAAPQTFDPWITRGTLRDFRTSTRARITELVKDFAKVQESGEYTYNAVGESGETIKLGKYGTIIPISWEALINDDLGAFNRLPTAVARKSKNLQADLVYGVLTGNPTMADGKRLFSTEHGNLGAASNLTIKSMSDARKALRTQKAPGEKTATLNLSARFMIVGPEMETEADQFLSDLYKAQKQADINIFQGRYTLIVESRITDRAWYLAADPALVDTVELDFLEAEPELFTEERWGFERDTYETKARTVVGTAPVDYRGLYKNPGGAAPQ